MERARVIEGEPIIGMGCDEHSDASIAERKRRMRKHFLRLRTSLGASARSEADARIESRLTSLQEFSQAEVILTYLDFGPEVRTRGIIERAWKEGKVVALPRCVPGTHEMRWYRIGSFEGLVRSRLGVEEPVPVERDEQALGTGQLMMSLVPALTFDVCGYRLGYGGGFYDSFLASFDGVSVGLCRDEQLSTDLRLAGVIDRHDVPTELVVTESRLFRAGS